MTKESVPSPAGARYRAQAAGFSEREQARPGTHHEMHLLKNGAPAHQFTDEDRRKAAAVTNEIRRLKREIFELERNRREIEEMVARDEARRQRRREKRRARARIARYA